MQLVPTPWIDFFTTIQTLKTNLETMRDKNYVYMKMNMSQENRNRAFLSQFPRIPGYPHIFVLADTGT